MTEVRQDRRVLMRATATIALEIFCDEILTVEYSSDTNAPTVTDRLERRDEHLSCLLMKSLGEKN